MKSPDLFQPGSIIQAKYIIEKPIGQGGMSKTYLAKIEGSIYKVVLKVVVFSEMKVWKTLELFEREAKTLKNLDHPNIPKYIDDFHIETEDEIYYILVMEYIQGKNLYDLIHESKKFTEHQVINILKSLLQTLDYIHTLNPAVIHRDIQPKNIIYKPTGKVYLVDFGGVGQIIKETLYGGSTMIGTFGYFPHEQLLGKAYPSSDLYSLGMTMIFLLTGKDPSNLEFKEGCCHYSAFIEISDKLKSILDQMIKPFSENRIRNAKLVIKLLDDQIVLPFIKHDQKKSVKIDNVIETKKLDPETEIEMVNYKSKGLVRAYIMLSTLVNVMVIFANSDNFNSFKEISLVLGYILTANILLFSLFIRPIITYFKTPKKIISILYNEIQFKSGKDIIDKTISFSKIKFIDLIIDKYKGNYLEIKIDDGNNNNETINVGENYQLHPDFFENLKDTIENYKIAYIQNSYHNSKS